MDDRPRLLVEMQRVFPPVVVSGRAAPHICPECDDISSGLAHRAWAEVPSELLFRNPDVLPLLSEAAYVAYLPAWLREGLLHPDQGVPGMLLVNLSASPPVARFSSEQAQIIVAAVKAMCAASIWSENDPVCRERIEAIERIWAQRAV